VVETAGDLDERLNEDAIAAPELAPDVFPQLVRLEKFAAVEGRATRCEANVETVCGREDHG